MYFFSLLLYNVKLIKFQKITRAKHGSKYQKLCHNQSPFPGKGQEALWQKVQIFRQNMVRFNRTHSFLNLQAKFFNYKIFQLRTLAKFPAN